MTDTVNVCPPQSSDEVFEAPVPEPEPKLDSISVLLKRTADINAELKDGNTYLHIAVAMQKESIVKLLLDNGADPNRKNQDGIGPLPIALKLKNAGIAKLLVEQGADVNEADEAGNSLVHVAVLLGDEAALGLLLDSWADHNKRNSGGLSALQIAIKLGLTKLGLMLIEVGADVNEVDDETGATLLHLAVTRDSLDLIYGILSRMPDVEARTKLGETALHLAAGRRTGDCVAVMEKLLFQQADINARCDLGETPLMKLLWTASGEDVRFLTDLAADVRVRNVHGESALHLAAELGNDDALLMLLRLGLHVDLEDYRGNTALHGASSCCRAETIQLLHTRGAKCNLRNFDGKTPLTLLLDTYRSNQAVSADQVGWTLRTLLFYSATEFWSLDGRALADLEEVVWKPVVEHVARLAHLEKYPGENVVREIKRHPAMREYYWACKAELCQAANANLRENFSFLLLLHEQEPGFNYHQHEGYKDDYDKADFGAFPIYGEIMRRIA